MSKEACFDLLKTLDLNNLNGYDLLVKNYCGNPFFIKFVSKKIRKLSSGNIAKYLNLETNLIGGISEWLNIQIDRISFKEEQVLYWITLFRCPVSFQLLLERMHWVGTNEEVFNCLESLENRSLIERVEDSDGAVLYFLNSVLLKYVSMRLVDEIMSEISTLVNTQVMNRISILCTHSLFLTSEDVDADEARQRYILNPIKRKLIASYYTENIELQLTTLLNKYENYQFENKHIVDNMHGLVSMLRSSHSRTYEAV